MRPKAIIVDPASSALLLPKYFKQYDWDLYAVMSDINIPGVQTTALAFSDVLYEPTDKRKLSTLIRDGNIKTVIAGYETAIELADHLAHVCNVPGNNPATSPLRRNKAAMGQAVQDAGIATAAQFSTNDLKELKSQLRKRKSWPVVIKPLDSAGSDQVTICQNAGECVDAFRSIVGNPNKLGGKNTGVLCQDFLKGQQYLVNTISIKGRHHIVEIWEFNTVEVDGIPMYDTQYLLVPYGELEEELIAYTHSVLNALEIRYGPAHTEIIMTSEGPRLLECAARLPGKVAERTMRKATGHDIAELCFKAYTNPSSLEFLPERYTFKHHVGIAALRSPVAGVIGAADAINALKRLHSFSEVVGLTLKPNIPVVKTVDLFTCPGLVYFLHDSEQQIQNDMKDMRRIENEQGLFVAVA